jgi:flagellar biosynthesis protein FlhF
MKPTPFIAADADSALKQVQEAFGPEAVVVSVRRLPAHGISKLWHAHGQIEVLACPPHSQPAGPRVHTVPQGANAYVPFADELVVDPPTPRPPRRWHSLGWLESMGLMPEMADRLEHELEAKHGTELPPTPIAEWGAVRDIIAAHWVQLPLVEYSTGRPHVFIGPPGSGKTTALCKWMTQVVLAEDRSVRVWRLDGAGANTSEFLSLHCEMMGVSVERFWAAPEPLPDLMFVDLPGVEMHDPVGLRALREVLAALPLPHVHLVLNAAYHGTILFEQFRSFAPLGIEDIIFTHLDEDPQRVKLWNFVLGTNCTVSFLGAGQKIPGDFRRAESALLFPHGKAQ